MVKKILYYREKFKFVFLFLLHVFIHDFLQALPALFLHRSGALVTGFFKSFLRVWWQRESDYRLRRCIISNNDDYGLLR